MAICELVKLPPFVAFVLCSMVLATCSSSSLFRLRSTIVSMLPVVESCESMVRAGDAEWRPLKSLPLPLGALLLLLLLVSVMLSAVADVTGSLTMCCKKEKKKKKQNQSMVQVKVNANNYLTFAQYK